MCFYELHIQETLHSSHLKWLLSISRKDLEQQQSEKFSMPVVSLVQKEATPQELEGQVIFYSLTWPLTLMLITLFTGTLTDSREKWFFCKIFISEIPYVLVGYMFK